MLLTDFDPNKKAIINPEDLHQAIPGFPEVAVSCFSRWTFERMLHMFPHEEIYRTGMANVAVPIYKIKVDGQDIVIFNSPVGPLPALLFWRICGLWEPRSWFFLALAAF